ncbi:MAG: hypothetical protein P8X74_10855 [Reinekea sp.]
MFFKNCRCTHRFTLIFGKQRGINGLRTAPLWNQWLADCAAMESRIQV